MQALNEALEFTLQWEGEYANDPKDPGGETLYGITRRDHPEILDSMLEVYKKGKGDKAEAVRIASKVYQQKYWNPLRCSAMQNRRLACVMFDTAVNVGILRASKMLQEALNDLGCGLVVDGIVGPKTLGAISRVPGFTAVVTGVLIKRTEHYTVLAAKKSYRDFFRGWMNRLVALNQAEFG